MKLTKNLKAKILKLFKEGESIEKLSTWYGVQPHRVECLIREALLVQTVQDVQKVQAVSGSDGVNNLNGLNEVKRLNEESGVSA